MKRIVIKFGGTSVGKIEKIINSAKIIKKRHEEGNEIIVVVSAMSGTTNDLINRSKKISDNFDKSELDVLMSSGEQISSSLLSSCLFFTILAALIIFSILPTEVPPNFITILFIKLKYDIYFVYYLIINTLNYKNAQVYLNNYYFDYRR